MENILKVAMHPFQGIGIIGFSASAKLSACHILLSPLPCNRVTIQQNNQGEYTRMSGFLSFFRNTFNKLFGKAPSVLQEAQSVLNITAPAINLIVAEADPSEAQAVSNITAEIQADVGTAASLISQSHNATDATTLAAVSTSFAGINANLNGLLAANHVKNTSTQAKVKAIIGEVAGVITNLANAQAASKTTKGAN